MRAVTVTTGPSSGAAIQPPVPAGRVLVVDDNAANQLLAARMLARLGYEVRVAGDGRDALGVLEVAPHDVVLMDCQMPGMDGYEATAEIRRREGTTRQVAIVAMTAGVTQWDEQTCLETGMDAFLGKPVDWKAAAGVLARWTVVARSRSAAAASGPGSPGLDPGGPAPARTPALDPAIVAEIAALEDGGDEGLLDELLTAFVEDATGRVATLRTAVAGEGANVAGTAHSLRGSSLSFGARSLAGLCAEVEAAAAAGNAAAVVRLVEEMEAELARVAEEVAERFGRAGRRGQPGAAANGADAA